MIKLQYLYEALSYDSATGHFTWRMDRPKEHFTHAVSYKIYMTRNAGKRAGSPMKGGYISLNLGGKFILAHRAAFAMFHGIEIENLPKEIDHRDTITSNNTISNLRAATRISNMYNVGIAENNTSGFKGVSAKCGKWVANIRVNGNKKHLGYFSTPAAASRARDKAANDLHGEFARSA